MTAIRPLLALPLLVALALAGCGSAPRAAAGQSLAAYRYAVVSFPNHMALGERARADLKEQGFEVLLAGDPRLDEPAVVSATLWFDLVVERRSAGDAVRARAVDKGGVLRYERVESADTQPLALDAALQPLAGLVGKHEMLEL